jgi:hypothetical protein
MKCKFTPEKECIQSDIFEMWKDDKKETAWLTLGVCPECLIYNRPEKEVKESNNG